MTGMELVLAAVAAGASTGVADATSSSIRDAYAAFRTALRRALTGAGEQILDAEDVDPDVWQAQLGEQVVACGADQDTELLAAARRLLELHDPPGVQAGKYTVEVRDSKGVQVGDHNTQTNDFS
ncbi:hypothetical protein ACIO8F_40460 [Streptomyces sp. NPDC087228]|uniref:hypothetical protein n=1 Tax=unclassified Streptomyces TaxID=2593676 RepID=UPI0037F3F970